MMRAASLRVLRGGSSVAGRSGSQHRHLAAGPLEKTAYFDMHVDMKGKMVPFAGYELPVLYETEEGGVMNETLHTRAPGKSSIFDVSHMGQIKWTGKDAADFLEKCLVGDIKGLKDGEGRLTLITNADGGIIDDTVVSVLLSPCPLSVPLMHLYASKLIVRIGIGLCSAREISRGWVSRDAVSGKSTGCKYVCRTQSST